MWKTGRLFWVFCLSVFLMSPMLLQAASGDDRPAPPAAKTFDAEKFVKKLKIKDEGKNKAVLEVMQEYAANCKELESSMRPAKSDKNEFQQGQGNDSSGPPKMSEEVREKMAEIQAKLKNLRKDAEKAVSEILDAKMLKKWNKLMDKEDEKKKEESAGPGSGSQGGPRERPEGGGPGGPPQGF